MGRFFEITKIIAKILWFVVTLGTTKKKEIDK